MNKKNLSGIVVYTIHGGEEQNPLRDCLRKKITTKFGDNQLDESTYGITINGVLRVDVVKTLKQFCDEAEKETNCRFSGNDFVNLYYPTYMNETGNERCIWQVKILN